MRCSGWAGASIATRMRMTTPVSVAFDASQSRAAFTLFHPKGNIVTADMVKPGAVVIDVGMNRVEDASTKSGTRLVGDVDFDGVREVASHITPVPGGVGPMTIAMLLRNTLTAAERSVA